MDTVKAPPCAVGPAVGLAGLAGTIVAIGVALALRPNPLLAVCMLLIGTAAPMVAIEARRAHRATKCRMDAQITTAEALRQFALKLYFIPAMLFWACLNIALLYQAVDQTEATVRAVFSLIHSGLFTIDIAFALLGYLATSKRLNTHIRSTNPTLLGWAVCLVCYPPLFMVWRALVGNAYNGYPEFYDWLAGSPLLPIWTAAVVGCEALYVSATVAFGLRFSNLSNRGIITSGPYRLFKHPSYIGKIGAWWLLYIPFIADDWRMALLGCGQLSLLCSLYYFRAKTEETHLRADPEYRAYEAWIDANGLIARLRRLISPRPTAFSTREFPSQTKSR